MIQPIFPGYVYIILAVMGMPAADMILHKTYTWESGVKLVKILLKTMKG